MILASAVGFSWAATDSKDLERQKALRHHMSGKVRLRARTTLTTFATKNGDRHLCAPSPRPQSMPAPRSALDVVQLPVLTPAVIGFSPQFTDGDEELVKHVKRRTSMFTPESPEQILQMQQTRHELTGKLVPRLMENR